MKNKKYSFIHYNKYLKNYFNMHVNENKNVRDVKLILTLKNLLFLDM